MVKEKGSLRSIQVHTRVDGKPFPEKASLSTDTHAHTQRICPLIVVAETGIPRMCYREKCRWWVGGPCNECAVFVAAWECLKR